MDNQNQKGFIDTATSLGQAAYDVTKTIARAAAGDSQDCNHGASYHPTIYLYRR